MDWTELLAQPWRKVILDLTSLSADQRVEDPMDSRPPILNVYPLDAMPDPGNHEAPPGYTFIWHDLRPDLAILFIGITKKGD